MWEAVAALAAVVGVGVSAYTIVADGKRTRQALSMDLLMRVLERFEAADFRNTRARAANYLLKPPIVDRDGIAALDAVLNFFETLALYEGRGAIDCEAIWHTFGVWLMMYRSAGREYITEVRRSDPLAFREFLRLCSAVQAHEDGDVGAFWSRADGRDQLVIRSLHYEAGTDGTQPAIPGRGLRTSLDPNEDLSSGPG